MPDRKGEGGRGKGRLLRCIAGLLLATAVTFNTMPFTGAAVSASEGTECMLCAHHPEHGESCPFVCEICNGETPEELENVDETAGEDSGQTEGEDGSQTEGTDSGQTSGEDSSQTEGEDSGQTETEKETESGIQETDNAQTEIKKSAELTMCALGQEFKTQDPETVDETAKSANLDFSADPGTPSGDLNTDGYHWEGSAGSYTLTLRGVNISGTVTLPDDTVTIVTEGVCSIDQLGVNNLQKTELTFSGGGELTINERINISGGNYNAVTIGTGARVNAKKGISIGASGGVDSTVTVNGTLTVNGEGSNAISAGEVIVGSGGTLSVSGDKGVAVNGRSSNSFEDVFIVREGAYFTASCQEFNVRVYANGATVSRAVNVPDGYLPDDCEVKEDSGTIKLMHKSTGAEYAGGELLTVGTESPPKPEDPPKREDPHSHSYRKDVLENVTCTKAGTAIYTCGCRESYTKSIPALKHEYMHQVTAEPTVSAEGVMTYTCRRCGYQYTERIPMLEPHEHAYNVLVLKEATCTEAGISMYACACGAAYTESVPMLTHSYTSRVTRKPTVSEDGVMTYTCSRCSSTYTRPVDRIEDSLSKADSRPESGNPSIREDDKVTEESTETASEETELTEEQRIVTADADTDADADVSADVDAVDNILPTGKQFPWWVLLAAALVMIAGLCVAGRQKNKKEL